MRKALLLLLLAVLPLSVVACGDDTTGQTTDSNAGSNADSNASSNAEGDPDAANADDVGSDDASDAADVAEDAEPDVPLDPCYPGRDEGGDCAVDLRWETADAVPGARDHHATERVGRRLLVAGGGRDSFAELLDDVQTATIDDDGALGPWSKLGELPRTAAGQTVTHHDGALYVLGGVTDVGGQITFADDGLRCVLEEDTLGACETIDGLSTPKWHHQAFVRDGYIYELGGVGFGGEPVDEVHRAPIGADGALGPWEAMTPLPEALSHHAMAWSDRAVYVVGGLAGQSPLASVYSAVFADDGAIEAWRTEAPLPQPRVTPFAALTGPFLFVGGGISFQLTGPVFQTVMLKANVDVEADDTSFEDWENLEIEYPDPAGHVHQAPVFKNRFYIIGGRTAEEPEPGVNGSTGAVRIGVLE